VTFDEINPLIPDYVVKAKDTLLIDSCNYIILNNITPKKMMHSSMHKKKYQIILYRISCKA
jgi:hypothetical protein